MVEVRITLRNARFQEMFDKGAADKLTEALNNELGFNYIDSVGDKGEVYDTNGTIIGVWEVKG